MIKKQYYKLDKNKPTIGLLMMLKNEEKRLHVTLDSVVGHVDAIIVYDTGSEDNTIDILQNFCEKNKINLYLKHGEFVDFAESRNVSLDFADTVDVHYLLLMDCNDELRGGEDLRKKAKEYLDKDNNAFLLCQEWWSGKLDKYFNVRFVKNRCGWRYRGSVHEWMKDTMSPTENPRFTVIRINEVVLYQDRTKDDDKSGKRFKRDRELLLRDHKADPKEPRTLFYLAQTCQCLQLDDEAMYYSKLRLQEIGFVEERFHSYMRCGTIAMKFGHDWYDSMKWFLRAYEEFERAEPLIKIAEFYKNKAFTLSKNNSLTFNIWNNAYMYISEACKLKYPDQCILFVDKGVYDYTRWHLMGIIAFYTGHYKEGKEACLKAIETNIDKEVNEKNLQFYLDMEDNKIHVGDNTYQMTSPVQLTKQQFINKYVLELKKQYPQLKQSQLQKKALTLWKNKNKN